MKRAHDAEEDHSKPPAKRRTSSSQSAGTDEGQEPLGQEGQQHRRTEQTSIGQLRGSGAPAASAATGLARFSAPQQPPFLQEDALEQRLVAAALQSISPPPIAAVPAAVGHSPPATTENALRQILLQQQTTAAANRAVAPPLLSQQQQVTAHRSAASVTASWLASAPSAAQQQLLALQYLLGALANPTAASPPPPAGTGPVVAAPVVTFAQLLAAQQLLSAQGGNVGARGHLLPGTLDQTQAHSVVATLQPGQHSEAFAASATVGQLLAAQQQSGQATSPPSLPQSTVTVDQTAAQSTGIASRYSAEYQQPGVATVPRTERDGSATLSQTAATQVPQSGEDSYSLSATAAALSSTSQSHQRRRLVPLSVPTDGIKLSEFQCEFRKHICFFQSTQEDLGASAQGRNKPIQLDQVGIICRFCAPLPPILRSRGAVYFPTSIRGIYQSAHNMCAHLLTSCKCIPGELRLQLQTLKSEKAIVRGGGKLHWESSAQSAGVCEREGRLAFSDSAVEHSRTSP